LTYTFRADVKEARSALTFAALHVNIQMELPVQTEAFNTYNIHGNRSSRAQVYRLFTEFIDLSQTKGGHLSAIESDPAGTGPDHRGSTTADTELFFGPEMAFEIAPH
jgi:hypothetical protein